MHASFARVTALLAVLSIAGAGEAQADEGLGLRLALEAAFGLGGEGELDGAGLSGSDDMEATLGAGVRAEYLFNDLLSFGGRFVVQTWEQDAPNASRSTIVDFGAFAKARTRLLVDGLEIYALIPFGLTVSVLSDDIEDTAQAFGAELDTGVGGHVGVLFGASYFIDSRFGAFLETGYMFHGATHEVRVAGTTRDIDLELNEAALNFGVLYRL